MSSQGRKQRGSALMIALIFLAVLGTATTATWRAMHMELSASREQRLQESAYFLAEAGLEKALVLLREDAAYRGEEDTPLDTGAFTVLVTPLEPGHFSIESTGYVAPNADRTGRHTLVAQLRLAPDGRVLAFAAQRKRTRE